MYKQLKKMREEEGFTLIELLIVIIILGVLAAIVVFSVSGITDRGKASACAQDSSTVATAIEAYYAQVGNYPTDESQLVPGFLHSVSTKYTFSGQPGGQTPPTVTAVSPCT